MSEADVEQLLLATLELPPGERSARIEALCEQFPALAGELRSRFAWLERLAAPGASAPGDRAAGPDADAEGEPFGEYRLLRQLGGGGMGVVYLARQVKPGLERTVALKLVRQGSLFSAEARERFRREAAAALRLDHPVICPVLDVGEVQGTPYIAMRYVPGETLAQRIAAARDSDGGLQLDGKADANSQSQGSTTRRRWGDLVLKIEAVARALHAAHEAGLVHRDIKPGNVIITPDGDPVLLDFGLVRDESDTTADSLTVSGQPLGTPAYMSPEQVRGGAVDRRTDVYSLGATLFECLTLRPPFTARTREALYHRILNEEPPSLRRVCPAVSADLAIVVATAMQKDPHRRYATMADFADDLRRVARLEPILARPPGPFVRTWLWCRRNRVGTALIAVSMAAAVLMAWQSLRLEAARKDALAEFRAARDAVDELIYTSREGLRDVPRVDHLRERLTQRALAFHQRFLDRHADDPVVRFDAALAFELRGVLLSDLGSTSEAETSLLRAERDYLDLMAADDGDPDELAYRLARCRLMLATVRHQLGAPEEAVAILRAAEASLEAGLSGAWRSEGEALRGALLNRIGDVLNSLRQPDLASDAYRQAVELFAARHGEDPNPGNATQLADAEIGLAMALTEAHDFEAADPILAEALGRLENIPETGRALGQRATGHRMRGIHLRRVGRHDEAREQLLLALPLFERLLGTEPDSPTRIRGLVKILVSLGHLHERVEAESFYRQALPLAERLRVKAPEDTQSTYILADVHYNLGHVIRGRDLAAAEESYRAAVELLEPAVEQRPQAVDLRKLLGMALNNLSVMQWEQDEKAPAIETLEEALRHKRYLHEQSPDHPEFRQALAFGLGNHAKHLASMGHGDRAKELFDESIRIRHELAEAHPEAVVYGADVLVEYIRTAGYVDPDAIFAGQRWLDALAPDVRTRYEQLPRFVELRKRTIYGVGRVLATRGEWSEAKRYAEQLLAEDPDYDPAQKLKAAALEALGQ